MTVMALRELILKEMGLEPKPNARDDVIRVGWYSATDFGAIEAVQLRDLKRLNRQISDRRRKKLEQAFLRLVGLVGDAFVACEKCHADISVGRLKACPAVTMCVGCARKEQGCK